MRNRGMLAVVFASVFAVSLWACVDPMSVYSTGVVFSGGEVWHPERIEQAAEDSTSYIKACTLMEASKGRPILAGNRDSCSGDPLTIKQVRISLNTLLVDVEYGGGCKYHAIELYTDKMLMKSNPAQMNLWLSHDGNGDNCEALISETMKFDLASTGIVQELILHVFSPGASEPFTESPLWSPVSGLKTQNCAYKLRSAYDENVMAHIGYFGGPFQDGSDGFRVLLIFDTTEVPSNVTKSIAMVAELKRLTTIGAVEMADAAIEHIGNRIAGDGGSDGQYWTAQDTVLPFNFWFDGTSVNGVKGVYGVRGCGSGVAYELPVHEFIPVSIAGTASQQRAERTALRGFIDKSGIHFRFAPITKSTSVLKVVNMQGREVAAVPLVKNAANLTLSVSGHSASRLPAGCYVVSIAEGTRTVQTGVLNVAGY